MHLPARRARSRLSGATHAPPSRVGGRRRPVDGRPRVARHVLLRGLNAALSEVATVAERPSLAVDVCHLHLAASAGEAGERYECDPHSRVVSLKARDRDVDAALEEVIRAQDEAAMRRLWPTAQMAKDSSARVEPPQEADGLAVREARLTSLTRPE